mmetsp:Transcript_5055/g.4627  ORF Transcript_5055/g.4627 Transcript_5055/m.4627 type:complete len:104 (-) Transcript_5055:34-345(-)
MPSPGSMVINPVYQIHSRYPVLAKCVNCGTTGMTTVKLEYGNMALFVTIFLFFCCLFCFAPFCCLGFIPLAFDELKDVTHSCSACLSFLARVDRHKFNQSENY